MEPGHNINYSSVKQYDATEIYHINKLTELSNSPKIPSIYLNESDSNLSLLSKIPRGIDDAQVFIENKFCLNLKTHEFKVQIITISKNEEYLASISGKSILNLWNLRTSKLLYKSNLGYSKIVSAEFSNDEKKLWIATEDGSLDYFDIKSQQLFTFHVSDFCIHFIMPVFDDKYIWYSTFEQRYVFIDNTGKIAYKRRSESLAICANSARKSMDFYFGTISSYLYVYKGIEQFERILISSCNIAINCLALTPDELTLCIGLENDQIVIMDLLDYKMEELVCEKSNIYSIVIPNWHTIYVIFENKSCNIHCYDLKSKSKISILDISVNSYFPLIYLRTKNKILYQDSKNFIKGLSLDNFESKVILSSHSLSITCLIAAANGKDLITAGSDSTIRIWDLEQKIEKKIIEDLYSVVTNLFITFNKKFLVSGLENGKIFIWNSETYEKFGCFGQHLMKITTITCDFSCQFIISCSEDCAMEVWEIKSLKTFNSIKYLNGSIHSFLTKYNKYHIDVFNISGTVKHRVWKFKINDSDRAVI